MHQLSLIHVERNAYSVNSRLIGERVEARVYLEHVEVWYGQRCVEDLPRLRGRFEASSGLPAHYRVADPEAGRLRELPLSRGSVSHQSLPDGVRHPPGERARASCEGIPEDSEAGGG